MGGPGTDIAVTAGSTLPALALAFAAGAGAGLALWLSNGAPWPLTPFANLAHLLGVAALALLPVAWALHAAHAVALLLGYAVACGLVHVRRWSGASRTPSAPDGTRPALRVLTYNLGTHLAGGSRLVEGLRASGADLVALQELSRANAELLERELADLYPHRLLFGAGTPGRGLLSRFPIREHEFVRLRQNRRHLLACVETDVGPLAVWVLHLSVWVSVMGDVSYAHADLRELLERHHGERPLIVCGDMNASERSSEWRLPKRAGLVDSFRSAGRGPGFTWPMGGRFHRLPAVPFVRIDYIWHSPDLRATSAAVGPDLGSDHLPLIAVIER